MERKTVSGNPAFPLVLKYTDIRSYVFTVAFVTLSVLVPFIFHQFHLAGPTFLPMHIFVLVAGLLFGWRAGLVVGLLTPVTSYAVSGMPLLNILPQVVIELSAYGLVAGVLRERFTLPVLWSLLGAMVGGRLAMLAAAAVVYFLSGQSYSPLGAESNPLLVVWSAVRQGLPGIILQVGAVPVLVFLLEKLSMGKRGSRQE